MRIGIISDLHCRHSGAEPGTNTNLFSDKLRKPYRQHPVEALIKYLEKEPIEVDYLLCPGDITDKYDIQGFITGWSYLEELKAHLNAKDLIACLGNHDVDSRGKHSSYNTYQVPKSLKDNFPFNDKISRNEYYSEGYTLIKKDNIVFFIFNSVHSHTNSVDAQNSIITDEMLENIREDLVSLQHFDFKVAMTHHHPIKHSNVSFKYKDIDVIEKGEKLVELLEEFDFQVFIHGHKHEPRIVRYNTIPVFASGSFSSLLNLTETNSQNYFHVLELTPKLVKGTFSNYEYVNILGWEKASGGKIRHSFGFGANTSLDDFCIAFDGYLTAGLISTIDYGDFSKNFPDFKHFLPVEQDKILENLKTKFKIITIQNKSEEIIQFVRS